MKSTSITDLYLQSASLYYCSIKINNIKHHITRMALTSSSSKMFAMSESTVFIDQDSSSSNLPQLSKQSPSKNNDSIVLAPWLVSEPPILNRFWPKSKSRENSEVKQRNIITCPTREKIIPRNIQICHEEYKMNRTFLEFRIKASNCSVSKRRSRSDKTETISIENNEKFLKSAEISRKNITAFTLSADKTPKMKFLERKLKVKESLASSLRRKKRIHGIKYDQDVDNFDIKFANIHENILNEERDNLASIKFRRTAQSKPEEFTKWKLKEVSTIQ